MMNGAKSIGLRCGASFLALLSATQANAQDAADREGGDIVVTARRVEERLQDVPISITVFTQEQISQRNIVSAADLGTYTPSLTANSRFGPDKATFAIRGFAQDPATSPSVGVYFAEVSAVQSTGPTPAGNGAGPGAFFDLQNVQVLKGPQGTLFGRNTTGGAILLTPQKPTDRLEGYVEGSIGDHGLKRAQAVLNVPLADTFKVRLGVDRNHRDGYLVNKGVGPAKVGSINYLAARLSILAELTPDLENYTVATFSRSNSIPITPRVIACNSGNGTFTPGVNLFAPGSNSFSQSANCQAQVARQNARGDGFWTVENNHPDPRTRQTKWQVINTTTFTASDALTIKNIVSYGQDLDATRFSISGDYFAPTLGVPFTLIWSSHFPGQKNGAQQGFTEELQFIGKLLDGRLNWQAGFYLENSDPLQANHALNPSNIACTDYFAFKCQPVPGFVGSLGDAQWTLASRSRGVYAQATFKLTERFSVTGGIRYTWDSAKAHSESLRTFFDAAGNPTIRCQNSVRYPGASLSVGKIVSSYAARDECAVDYAVKSQKPTWILDAEYKPIDDVMLYGKWSRGYRQGFINPNTVAFETWRPEKLDTYEIGAKASFRGQSVRGYFNIAGFYNDFTNQQIFASVNAKQGSGAPGAAVTVNAGRSVIKGVEIDGSVTVFDFFKFDLGYSYLDAKLKSLVFPTIPDSSPYSTYNPLPTPSPLALVPKNRVSLTGTFMLPLDESIGRVSLGATFVHTDSQFSSATPYGTLPASDLLNLNASWNAVAGMPIDLSLFVTNVTKQKVWLNITNGWNGFAEQTVIPGEPRMFGARIKYRFGN